ncbi:tudor domain containing protein 5 TDRD5 [Oopsacas minuta]|uniref:Tudor domain containing protein 5 TDRD5 n=1 Tax=Oopsacas minuta TaxID=111878 RepID=A0AAV7KFN1_9METZ|nr:tudor domain containing protein 5 TDRD5 [Oopsacas minuta]
MSIENIQETKKIIRSLLISAKNGLTSLQLERDFISQIGKPIPFKSYGHLSLESLLCSMPDVVLVSKRKGMLHLRGVATNETSHIARMVQLQTGGNSNIAPADNSRHRHKLFFANTVHRPEQPPSVPDYVCVQVRAILISYPNGVELANFPNAYTKRFGYCLQTSKFGFSSLRSFFSNIHGVSFFTRNCLEYIEYSSDVIRKKSPPSDRSPPGFSRHDSMPSFCEVAKKKIIKPTFQPPPETSISIKPIITELNPLSENPIPENGEVTEQTTKVTINTRAQEGDVVCSKMNQASPPSTPGTSVSKFIPPPPLNQRIRKPLNQAAQLAIYKQKHGQNMSSKLSKEVSDLLDTLPPSIPLDELVEAYKMRYGFDLPFKEFGFSSSQNLIQSLWQTCKLENKETGIFVTAFDGSRTSSSQTFVQEEQASLKSKIVIDIEIVNRIRNLLFKWPSGMPISLLQEKYFDAHHEELPYLELGFDDIYEMMIAIPDCVTLIPNKMIDPSRTDYVLHGIPIFDEECPNLMLPLPEKYIPSNNIILPFSKQPIPANWEFNVYIPFISNPDRFWVQIVGHLTYEALDGLLEDMTKFYNKSNLDNSTEYLLNNPGEGQNCAAPYQKDGYYYRAKIMKIPLPDQAEVFYVDYGNKSRVPLGSLRRIKPIHMVLPSQAIQCRLANVKPFDGIRWAPGSALKMKDFTNNLELQCKIQNIEPDDTLSVHLTDPKSESDQSINQALIASGIASHEENNIPLHPTRACISPEETQFIFSCNPPSLPPHIPNLSYPIPQPIQFNQPPPVQIPFQNNIPYYHMPHQYNTHNPMINPIPYPYPTPHHTYPTPYIPQPPIHPGYPPPPLVHQPAPQLIPMRPTSNFRAVSYRFPFPPTNPAFVSSQEDAYVYNDRDNQILEKMLKEKENKFSEEGFNPPPSMGTFEKVQKFLSTSSNPDQLQQQKEADKLRVVQLMQERGKLVDKGVDTSNKTAFDLYLANLNKMSSEIEEISIRLSETFSPTSTPPGPLFLPPPPISPPPTNPVLIPTAPTLGRGRLGPTDANKPRVQFKYKGIGRGGKMSDLI